MATVLRSPLATLAWWLCLWPTASSARLAETELLGPPLKIVVNSNPHYARPRALLMGTLKAAQFQNFSEMIVVLGGSQKDQVYKDGDITVVETTFMSYDLTGLSMLWRHRNHPWVRAQAYMYLLDTVTVGVGFPEKFENFSTVHRVGYHEYRASPFPSSNICLFGHGVVESYRSNFDTALAKQDGLWFESGHAPRGVRQLDKFARTISPLKAREEHGDPLDVYGTGFPRRVFWYPDLDLYKYIFWKGHGDLTGQIQMDGLNILGWLDNPHRF
ncbi:unnamed protein product [Durusdinium trenchii]|uniref:Uncharacterized protein n=3 Tax=Durusdinium trenchii TaxID=1381693 RepID=A0ABP0RIP2_9DINO